jgi:toxin-antitoxin system PIN domain toxin
VIAVDTNLLVYAHRSDSEWNEPANRAIATLASGPTTWGIPWPCVHEFFAIVTHPRIYDPPSTTEQAIDQLDAWLESPSVALLAEDGRYWSTLRDVIRGGRIVGPRVHDARIASLCRVHGVRELWTADRDFGRFPSLVTRNPLAG